MATATWDDVVVAAGEIRTYVVNNDWATRAALLMGGDGYTAAEVEPSIYNYGEVHLADPTGENGAQNLFLFTGMLNWDHAIIENHGLISVVLPNAASARAFSASVSSPDLYNSGQIIVQGLINAQAYFTNGHPDIENTETGLIQATSANSPITLWFWQSSGTIANAGQIIAHSTSDGPDYVNSAMAIAIGSGSGFGQTRIINSGLIQATDEDHGQDLVSISCAIHLGNDSHGLIVNSGTIRGEYAIYENTWNFGMAPYGSTTVHNTGTIDGNVKLDAGNDVVVNDGSIVGTIELGLGRDVYVGNGSTTPDHVNGGAGDDILFGGIDATLTGGAGHDTFAFTSATSGDGSATITDFTSGMDVIDLRRFSPTSVTIDGLTVTAVGDSGTLVIHASSTVEASDILTSGDAAAGTTGDDTLIAGLSASQMFGGDGHDLLVGSDQADILDGGIGIDTMVGGSGDDLYVVSEAGESIVELPGNGVDEVRVEGPAWVILSANVERLMLTGNLAIGGWGNELDNVMAGNSAANQLDGGLGNDTLNGGGGSDMLYGGDGHDSLNGGVGDDMLDGGEGRDQATYTYAAASVTVSLAVAAAQNTGGDGIDTLVSIEDLQGSVYGDLLTGNEGANQLFGLAGADRLIGNAGADRLDGGAGGDTMFGGAGDDVYVVDNAADKVIENFVTLGTDLVEASIRHTLSTNIDNLTLTGVAAINGTGNDLANILIGNSAANTLNGAGGADVMQGGLGNDIYIVNHAGDQVIEQTSEGNDLVKSSVNYTLGANIERLTLSLGAAEGTGNDLANILIGNAAANLLDGGAGVDEMRGAAGDDIYVVDHASDKVVETAVSHGNDTVLASVSYSLGSRVENLTLTGTDAINASGNAGANTLTGNGAANTLNGAAGADQMIGGGGDDLFVVDNVGDQAIELSAADGTDRVNSSVSFTLGAHLDNLTLTKTAAINGTGNGDANTLTGNSAANVLDGGGGADILLGAGGADTLDGGAGRDSLTGGTGADAFRFQDGGFAGLDTATCDVILDFSLAQGDTIQLDLVDADTGLAGDQEFAFIGGAAFGGTAGELRTEQIDGNTYLQGDTNGDSIADFLIRLDGLHTLTNSDFLL